eukprot:gene89-116_t
MTGFKSELICIELLQAMEQGNTWNTKAIVPTDRLRLLTVQHIDFQGQQKTGQIIVLDVCAEAVLHIFKQLYQQKFPIDQLQLMHHYQGNDPLSMAANNTSGYIDRNAVGSTKKSLHAYGLALDINPIQNPLVTMDAAQGVTTYAPKAGIAYANRLQKRLGKPTRAGMAEEIVEIFAANGFYWWGGYWDNPIDYQHFQVSPMLGDLYLAMPPQPAKELFETVVNYYNKHQRPLEKDLLALLQKDGQKDSLLDYYKKDKKRFNDRLEELTT